MDGFCYDFYMYYILIIFNPLLSYTVLLSYCSPSSTVNLKSAREKGHTFWICWIKISWLMLQGLEGSETTMLKNVD